MFFIIIYSFNNGNIILKVQNAETDGKSGRQRQRHQDSDNKHDGSGQGARSAALLPDQVLRVRAGRAGEHDSRSVRCERLARRRKAAQPLVRLHPQVRPLLQMQQPRNVADYRQRRHSAKVHRLRSRYHHSQVDSQANHFYHQPSG